jgi:hypothetical protein
MTRPDTWQPEDGVDLESAVYQAVGSASLAWVETPQGEFDTTWAKTVSDGLIAWIKSHYQSPWTPYMNDDGLCGCWTCVNERGDKIEDFTVRLTYVSRFIVCPDCGNKRCPKATWHANACTGSNDAEQPGSRYGGLE